MTVVARKFLARPVRSATQVWSAIADCVCTSNTEARREFESITGAAAALVAGELMKEHPFMIIGSGPRLRIYCMYDEDAISGGDKNEELLGWNPTEGDWTAYLPCLSEELNFFRAKFEEKTSRILCYDIEQGIPLQEESSAKPRMLSIDVKRFREL